MLFNLNDILKWLSTTQTPLFIVLCVLSFFNNYKYYKKGVVIIFFRHKILLLTYCHFWTTPSHSRVIYWNQFMRAIQKS